MTAGTESRGHKLLVQYVRDCKRSTLHCVSKKGPRHYRL